MLVPRRWRYEVSERIDAQGEVIAPLDETDIDAVIGAIREAGLDTVAVSLLFSFLNGAHERWLGERLQQALPGPHWTFHFTPTSASWLNAVESFFSKMTRHRIRRGVFRPIIDLQAAINAYLAEHNANPKPFVWAKSAWCTRECEGSRADIRRLR